MSEGRVKIALAGLYAFMAVLTFGHSAAASDRYRAACLLEYKLAFCPNNAPIAGLMSAALWPLYWSWEAWS
jgi:hypothetical protein